MVANEGEEETDGCVIDRTCLSVSVSSYLGTGANISCPHPPASEHVVNPRGSTETGVFVESERAHTDKQ